MKKFLLILLMLIVNIQILTGCIKNTGLSDSSSSSLYSESSNNDNELTPCGQNTDYGFYSISLIMGERANITYIDYDQKKEIFLCARPECSHDNDTCLSSIPLDESMSIPSLSLTKDSILLVQTQPNQTSNPHIDITDLDGANRRLLCEFQSNYVLSTKLYTDQENIYLFVDDINSQNITSARKLISVNLKSGAPKEIYCYSENESTAYIAGSLDRKLIIASIRFDKNNEVYTAYNFLNVDDGRLEETPFALVEQETTGSFISNEDLYTIDYLNETIIQKNLKNGESQSFDYSPVCESLGDNFQKNNIAIFLVSENLFRIEIPVFSSNDTTFHEFIYDATASKFHEFNLLKKYNGDVITVMAENNDKFLVRVDWIEASRNNNNGEPYTIFVPQYAFINRMNYINSVEDYEFIVSDIYS